jgi:Domain of unknown function (DUF4342)
MVIKSRAVPCRKNENLVSHKRTGQMSHHKDKTDQAIAHGSNHKKTTWTENVELVGDELVLFVKKLAAEGKVQRIRITEPDGDILVDMPLTLGAIAGGAVVLAAPLLAILGALAAFLTKVRLEIVRSGDGPEA